MKPTALAMLAAVAAAACAKDEDHDLPTDAGSPAGPAVGTPSASRAAPGSSRWDLQSSSEGVGLALADAAGRSVIRLFCPASPPRLLVNVPSFRPIASEERLSFGSGGDSVTLVADPAGDPQRGGVSGAGPVPEQLAALISQGLSASYGAQTSGPHPAPSPQQASAFVAACLEPGGSRSDPPPPTAVIARPAASACRTQDGRPVPANRLKGLGTEPFWAVRIDGRCVTYLTPENPSGTRIWTRFDGTSTSGSWSGFLDNRSFELRTRPQAACSDGMSDNRYPIAVTLRVAGEQRSGCAEPI